MGKIDWPGRGSRGKNSRRNNPTREPKHNQSMTALATEAAPYYENYIGCETYSGNDADVLQIAPITDQSLTKRLMLRIHHGKRATLLHRGDPFKMGKFKRENGTTRNFDSDTEF